MSILNFIVGLVIFAVLYLIKYLIIKFEIKINPDLFYALYRSDIDRILIKYDRKRYNKILNEELKKFNNAFIDKDDDVL